MSETENLKKIKHHVQEKLCTTRPPYRQGRKLTAVKVYTINNESCHLFVYGVPKINLRKELKNLFVTYGQILNIHVVADHETEIFTECYHIHFARIQSARIAKRFIDNKSFYGGVLHVCYAPEYESVVETKNKLLQRHKDVLSRINSEEENTNMFRSNLQNRKRKLPSTEVDSVRWEEQVTEPDSSHNKIAKIIPSTSFNEHTDSNEGNNEESIIRIDECSASDKKKEFVKSYPKKRIVFRNKNAGKKFISNDAKNQT